MKYLLAVVILCLVQAGINGQDKGYFSISLNTCPGLSYFGFSGLDEEKVDQMRKIKDDFHPLLKTPVSILSSFNQSNIFISTGICYYPKGHRMEIDYYRLHPETDSMYLAGSLTSDFHYRYLSIPVLFGYTPFRFDRHYLSLSLGIQVNYLLKSVLVMSYHENETTYFESDITEDYRSFIPDLVVELGYTMNISEKLGLVWCAHFNYGLLAVSEPREAGMHLYNFGGRFGLVYSFKKI